MKATMGISSIRFATALVALACWSESALAQDKLTPATHRELAAARAATARYHDVAQAEADGYVNINLYEAQEGFHWVNMSFIDAEFDAAKPEVLLYAPVPGEQRLQLVGVEYLVPIALSATAPAGFAGSSDRWRQDEEGFGMWELAAWIWEHNPNGLFTFLNPRVP